MKLNKKVLFIITPLNFRDEELFEPKKILEESGIKTTVSSVERNECIGMLGARVTPEKVVREVNPDEYDAVVVVGGSGSPRLADYPEVLVLLRRFAEKNKLIAAICLGPTVLAKAGILKGHKATVFPTDWSIAVLTQNGCDYVDEGVVVDGKIITAKGPKFARLFGEKIKEELTKGG